MAMISAFTTADKTSHNSHKFAFKLTPTNYGFWKSMIHPFLVTNNLYGYIDDTIQCPQPKTPATATSPSTDNPSYLHWIANDAHVRMILISTISESSFQHVQGITSRELWLSLERAYAPHNASREYILKTQLLKLTMTGDETSATYLARAQEYALALANIGEPFKDKDLVMLAVSGLREEYNGLKANLLARSPPVTFHELHGLLSDHDFMISRSPAAPLQSYMTAATAVPLQSYITAATAVPPPPQNPLLASLQQQAAQLGYTLNPVPYLGNSNPQAFYANRSTPGQFRSNRRENNRSDNRRQQQSRPNSSNSRPNSSNQQPRQSQFSWASTQNTVYGHCSRCGIGHIPSQCPNQQQQPNRTHPQANYTTFSDTSSHNSSTWFPDTGSNSHVTPDLTSLDASEAYSGNNSLHVGDGKPLCNTPA